MGKRHRKRNAAREINLIINIRGARLATDNKIAAPVVHVPLGIMVALPQRGSSGTAAAAAAARCPYFTFAMCPSPSNQWPYSRSPSRLRPAPGTAEVAREHERGHEGKNAATLSLRFTPHGFQLSLSVPNGKRYTFNLQFSTQFCLRNVATNKTEQKNAILFFAVPLVTVFVGSLRKLCRRPSSLFPLYWRRKQSSSKPQKFTSQSALPSTRYLV